MEPYWLSEEHAEAAGDLMAAAFFTAPGLSFMFPDPARRARLVPPFFAAMARLAVRCGEARALGEPLHAVALWMSPGREHPTEAEVAEAVMGAAVALLDEEEAGRFTVFRRHFDATHERLMDGPHWYLSFLAVRAGFGDITIDTVRHEIHFPSAREYVRIQLAATPLATLMPDLPHERQARLVDAVVAEVAVALHSQSRDGALVFPQECHLLSAHKRGQ